MICSTDPTHRPIDMFAFHPLICIPSATEEPCTNTTYKQLIDCAGLPCRLSFQTYLAANRRGSQAGRLADELRLIASGQAAASLALGDAGAQLIADAEAEKPLPREYALSRSSSTHDYNPSDRTHCGKLQEINFISENDHGERFEGDSRGKGLANVAAVVVGHNDNEHETVVIAPETASILPNSLGAETGDEFVPRGSSLPSAAASVAGSSMDIEMAAQEEEIAAAARIQSFLRRRRRQGRLGTVPGGLSKERATVVPVLSSAANLSDELSKAGSSRSRATADWFLVALRSLRREVDNFLLGGTGVDVGHGGKSDDGSAAPSVSHKKVEAQEPDLGENAGDSGSDEGTDKADGVDDDSDDDGDGTEPESSEDCPDNDWPTFPPVPLRARAPSLYTLPPPSSGSLRRIPRDSSERVLGVPASKGPFTKLDPEVAARLHSALSVFCLRASDVLTAFSPPPPPSSSSRLMASTATSSDSLPGSRPSAIPGTSAGREGTGGFRRLSSPEALRQKLRVEAQDASLAGLGRPWLLSSRAPRLPTRHKQEQQRSAFLRKKGSSRKTIGVWGGCGGIDQVGGKRRRTDAFGPLTPLGQRLARRYNAGVAARRRRILGETDAFRAVHVGRQLRIGASLNALERVERALDARLSCAREAKVSSAHIAELLDVVGRFVFSDSQVRKKIFYSPQIQLEEASPMRAYRVRHFRTHARGINRASSTLRPRYDSHRLRNDLAEHALTASVYCFSLPTCFRPAGDAWMCVTSRRFTQTVTVNPCCSFSIVPPAFGVHFHQNGGNLFLGFGLLSTCA